MTKILLSAFVLFFGLNVSAARITKTNYMTDKYMKIINLSGLKISNVDTGEQLLAYKIQRAVNITKAEKAVLVAETKSKPVSAIYELDQESNFQNVYVYIGKMPVGDVSKAKYMLNVVMVNNPNSLFSMDFPITKATGGVLTLEAGSSWEPETAKATLRSGTFWPY